MDINVATRVLIAAVGAASLLSGCTSGSGPNADPKQLLKWSMSKYEALDQAEIRWRRDSGQLGPGEEHVLHYYKPNVWCGSVKVPAKSSYNASDGKHVCAWNQLVMFTMGEGPTKEAPSHIAEAGTSELEPGWTVLSPIISFFAGPSGYDRMVDPNFEVTELPREVVDGTECRVISFVHERVRRSDVAIALSDGFVRRWRFPMMRSGPAVKSVTDIEDLFVWWEDTFEVPKPRAGMPKSEIMELVGRRAGGD